MGNNDINKKRVCLGFMICLMSYFIICLILKAFGIDLFEITQNSWSNNASNYINSNIYLLTLFQSALLCINLFFILSISSKRYDTGRMVIISIMLLAPMYGINLLFNWYQLPTWIVTVIIPYIISLCLVKERKLKEYLFTTIRYIVFSIFIILIQMGLIYLKVTLLKFNYHGGNLFNTILLNLDLFIIYFSVYFLLKYTNIREWFTHVKKQNKKNKEE